MSPGERPQLLLVEHLGDQAELAQGGDVPALAGRDPGRLLAAVLERVEAEVGEAGDVAAGRVHAEDPALVARAIAIVVNERRLDQRVTQVGEVSQPLGSGASGRTAARDAG